MKEVNFSGLSDAQAEVLSWVIEVKNLHENDLRDMSYNLNTVNSLVRRGILDFHEGESFEGSDLWDLSSDAYEYLSDMAYNFDFGEHRRRIGKMAKFAAGRRALFNSIRPQNFDYKPRDENEGGVAVEIEKQEKVIERNTILVGESVGYIQDMILSNERAIEKAIGQSTKDHLSGVVLGLAIALAELNRLQVMSGQCGDGAHNG